MQLEKKQLKMDMPSNDIFSQRGEALNIESPLTKNDIFNQRGDVFKKENDELDYDPERAGDQPLASLVAHGLGAAVALPGNVRDLAHHTGEQAQKLRKSVHEKLGLSWSEDYFKNSDLEEKIQAPFKFLLNKLPNSEDVNNYIDEYAGGALAPKDEKQKFANELAEDVVNSFLNRGPKNIFRNLVVPGVSNVVRKGLELYGVDPQSSQIGKALTWIGLDLAGLSNPRQVIGNNIRNTRRLIPANDTIPITPRDVRFLDQFEQRLMSGGTSPSKTAALTKIGEIRGSIVNGQVPARNIHDFYRTMNEIKSSYGAFSVEGSGKPAHVFNLNRVQNLTRNMLQRYGRTNHEFMQDFRENNAAWAALEQSDAISAFVTKNYNKPFVSEASKALFHKPYGIPIAVGLGALERTQAFLQRLANPTLRRYYGDVLRHSLQDNRAAMISSMEKFDRAAAKEEGIDQ